MPTTSPNSLPYPGDGDPPDGPGQLSALAGATQTALNAKVDDATLADLYRTGIVTVASSGSYKNSATIDFSSAGFASTPHVQATIAGDRDKRIVVVSAASATGATIIVHTADGSALGTSTDVYWVALRRN
jgi:hypothetical protein